VGRLEGTGWLNDVASNIVLVAHVEDEQGDPGPFAYLFHVQMGDVIILQDGTTQRLYYVASINYVEPTDISYLRQDGTSKLTMITCSYWDARLQTHHKRLVVVAVPADLLGRSKS
jgi:LPXTG-site transpeptidase (sortase) family protein